MIRTGKTWMVAALAAPFFMSTAAMAASSVVALGNLGVGEYTLTPQPTSASSNVVVYSGSFGLQQTSVLKGLLTGVSTGAFTLTESWFNQSTGVIESQQLFRSAVVGGKSFDLGVLPVTLPGISPRTYEFSLSAALSDLGLSSGAQLALSVQAVPEPGTWGLMALGLVGVAAARRRRAP